MSKMWNFDQNPFLARKRAKSMKAYVISAPTPVLNWI